MPKFYSPLKTKNLQYIQKVSINRYILLIPFLVACVTGCSLDILREKIMAKTSDDKDAIGLTAERLNELDQATYSYADRFVTIISDAADRATKANPTKEAHKEALRLKLHNSSSIYAIASGPNPLGQLLDMATVATLNKINMVDEGRAKMIFPNETKIIENAFHAVHDDIWGVAKRFLKPSEIETIQGLIKKWRLKHPDVTTLAYVRFDDFARANAGLKQSNPEIGGLFDEINKVNKTVESAQEFGERTFFYFQRYPRLLQWQTERTVEGVMDNNDIQKLEASVHQMVQVAQIFAQETRKLHEREAAVHKALGQVSGIVGQINELTPKSQAMLQDGQKLLATAKDTSVALGDTLKIVDNVSAKFKSDKPEPIDAKPFDIKEYQQTAQEVTKIVGGVNTLMSSIQGDGTGKGVAELQKLVDTEIDHVVWRIAQLAFLIFFLSLLYCFISRRVIKAN